MVSVEARKRSRRFRKSFPLELGNFCGYVKSQCIPKSSAPLLLSLDVQRALGMILDVNRDTVTFVNLGLYHLPLIRTQDGGLGVRITDFARKDILHPEKTRRKIIETDELTMFALDESELKGHQDPSHVFNDDESDQEDEIDQTPTKDIPCESKGKDKSQGVGRNHTKSRDGRKVVSIGVQRSGDSNA